MEQNLDDYSPSSTTIKFDHPIPLLRGPVPAAPSDDPSSGQYVLAFKSPKSWASAYKTCNSKIIEQCEGAARVGCALAASNKCKSPWWRNLIGKGQDLGEKLKEREECEVREMKACLAEAKEKCVGFAKEKCRTPFREARIAVSEVEVMRRVVSVASMPERYSNRNNKLVPLILFDKCRLGITNYKGSDLLGADAKYGLFLEQKK